MYNYCNMFVFNVLHCQYQIEFLSLEDKLFKETRYFPASAFYIEQKKKYFAYAESNSFLSLLLQILQNEVRQLVVEMQAGVAAVNGVVLVGIEEHLILLAGLVELGHKVDGVLEMNVVVGSAVDEQIVAFQLVGEEAG